MIVAVVPLKRLSDAKSRLSPGLPAENRSALALALARRAITALKETDAIARVAVVSPEPELASQFQADWLPDDRDLNSSLARGVRWAEEMGAASLLIVPADLPLITAGDVQEFIASAADAAGITICATHDGGTGAILLTPPRAVPPAFGPKSFERHITLAEERGVAVHRVTLPAFESDLDTLADLALYRDVPYL
jgi:2-phospho-L-lactate/phosphoenolpyruvate guanylyltransferase